MLALPAFLFMLIIQGLAFYQLFSPFYLWPPKITLPEELDKPEEPLEYEVNLDPGPMGPTPTPKPAESTPKPIQSAVAQTQSALKADSPPAPTPVAASQPPSPVPAAAVVSVTHSTPAPQPLLALEATPAPSAPEVVLVPSVDVASQATTEQPAEERGAANGAPANSDAVSTPVRPLAIAANAAPDRVAAAPISILPGVQAPMVEPVIAANPMAIAERAIDRVPLDLTIAEEKPVVSEVTAPAPALDVTRPMRVQPDNPKPDLRVEQTKPSVAKPLAPAAALQPVLSRADAVSANPSSVTTPDLRVDADAVTPNVAKPAAPAAPAASPVLTSAPATVSASELVRLEVAREEIARPTMAVQGPIAAPDSPSANSSSANSSAADASSADRSAAPARNRQSSNPNAANSGASTADNSAAPAQNDGASGLPSDPFARAGSGKGPRDLLGQGIDAAAAQVGANGADSYERGNAFRRYSDPFADDAPNPLAGLRLREPQMFSDVTRFLVKTFGPAALGFAVGASSEIDDFSGPNAGVLIEQWIQQHHGDLQRECRMRQETMDEHIRRLLCGEP